MIKLRRGKWTDLKKYYTMMEVDFDSKELLGKLVMLKGIIENSADLWVAYEDESRIDVGYAFVLSKNVYNYVILKYMGVFPWYREKGVGKDIMRLLIPEYKDKNGIIVEIPVFEENDELQINKLRHFFERFGFVNVDSDYRIGGAPVILMCKSINGTAEISDIAHRIITDIYTRYIPGENVDIKKFMN